MDDQNPAITDNNTPPRKQRTRTTRACDACKSRKIKCAYDVGATCRSCETLRIRCTQNIPRRRRGPSSKLVEEMRRKEAEERNLLADVDIALQYPVSTDTSGSHGLERFAPVYEVQQIITDWFEYVHPVAPLLHRDSFIRRLNDSGSHDIDFVNLVISICSATIASLPRKSIAYDSNMTVQYCYETYRHNQRHRSDEEIVDLKWCQTRYNFAVSLITLLGADHPDPQVLFAEATAGVGRLLHHQWHSLTFTTQELVKRLNHLCIAANCTMGLHGRPYVISYGPVHSMQVPKPLDISDADLDDITPGQEQWHGNTRSYVPGLNTLIDLFMLWFRSQQDGPRDLSHLRKHLDTIQTALDYVPPELRWRGGLSRPSKSNFGTDTQMVNLYITQIHIRSCLLDQMHRAAVTANDDQSISEVVLARQTLVEDMLAIIYQMPEDVLEANGYSLLPKLRDIGLTLLNETNTSERSLANLERLLAKLERLDTHRPTSQIDTNSPVTSLSNMSHPT